MFYFKRLIFNPIRRKDKGKYTCYITPTYQHSTIEKRSVLVKVSQPRIKTEKVNLNKQPLEALNQKTEFHTAENMDGPEMLQSLPSVVDHIVGIVGETHSLPCPTPGEFIIIPTYSCIYIFTILQQLLLIQ